MQKSVAPVRLCCGQRHFGVQCPDGLVMCCICFKRVTVDHLLQDPEEPYKLDICDEHPEEVTNETRTDGTSTGCD